MDNKIRLCPENVLCVENSARKKDSISINWTFTEYCNYDCSYCFYRASSNKKGYKFVGLDSLKIAADNICKLTNSRVDIILTGGEPTMHPDFIPFIEYILDKNKMNNIKINIITNMSRNLSFFKELAEILSEYPNRVSINASLHYEYANIDDFVERVKYTASCGINTNVLLLAHPLYMEDIKKVYLELKGIVGKFLSVVVKIVRDRDVIDSRYKDEDINWIREQYGIEKEKKHIKILYVDSPSKAVKHVEISPSDMTAYGINRFINYLCHAGRQEIGIDFCGNIVPAVCFRSSACRWNPFINHNIFIYNQEITYNYPAICPFEYCRCPADYNIDKYSEEYIEYNTKEYDKSLLFDYLCVLKMRKLYEEMKYEELINQYYKSNLAEAKYYIGLSLMKIEKYTEAIKLLLEYLCSVSRNNGFIGQETEVGTIWEIIKVIERISEAYEDNNKQIETKMQLDEYKGKFTKDAVMEMFRSWYRNKEYDKILAFQDGFDKKQNPIINYFVGKVYKERNEMSMAALKLQEYMQEVINVVEEMHGLEKDLFVSSYFHLGEIYYAMKDLDNALINFKKCNEYHKGKHVKASEYIKNISSMINDSIDKK